MLEDYVVKHEAQLSSALSGKKHLEGIPEDAKLAADRLHIDKIMADTNYLHGDGLFPLRYSNGQLIDLNGKVIADGTTMKVKVQDYLALIDGFTLGNKELKPSKVVELLIVPSDVTNSRIDLVCLKPALDNAGKQQHADGTCYVITGIATPNPVAPTVPDGSISLATVKVNSKVTVIKNENIIDIRDYLLDIDDLNDNLNKRIDESIDKASRELIKLIVDSIATVRDEIAAGDNVVKTELQAKIDLVKADLANTQITIGQIRVDLTSLRDYVDEKVALLESQTTILLSAVLDLRHADEQTVVFKQAVTTKIEEIQGQMIANTVDIQNNLERIETLEYKLSADADFRISSLFNTFANNLMLAFFKISVLLGASIYNLINGIMDIFVDETGIDKEASENEVYNSINDYYCNFVVGESSYCGNDLIARNTYTDPGYTYIETNFAVGQSGNLKTVKVYVKYAWGKYTFKIFREEGNILKYIDQTEAFNVVEGVNTLTLANPIPVLVGDRLGFYTDTDYPNMGQWGGNGYYRKQGNIITDYDKSGYFFTGCILSIGCEVEIIGETYDMTLVSKVTVAKEIPTNSRIIVFEEDKDAIAENTDIKAYISRDGGATFTQHTLVDEGYYELGRRILSSGVIDISAQPLGTNMKYKIETLNGKRLKIHGIGVNWD